jgi:hypothetical protein
LFNLCTLSAIKDANTPPKPTPLINILLALSSGQSE